MAAEARIAMLKQTAAALPLSRVGVAEDIAWQIFVPMRNGFATGSIVYIDGAGSIT